MRTLEEIVDLEGLKTKSKNLKQFFYDKFIRKNINYYFLYNYPELISLFKNSKKINLDQVNWYKISSNQKLSESFIREFKDKVEWSCISKYQKLSESFIIEFRHKVNWYYISEYQKLSESFIREFKDKVTWMYISLYQKLSEEFIREFKDKLDWYEISKYQKLSESFIKEFQNKLYFDGIRDSWNYKDESFKKKAIIESKMYECHDDHFIAFKGIRSDRYSKYNFQYQYLKGETYTCHADHSNNENSFGLSVWTEKEATNYCSQLVVKVKVYYKDVARMVHKNGKIRCTKINILN